MLVPWRLVLSAHKQVHIAICVRQFSNALPGQGSEPAQPAGRVAVSLVGECAHGQAVHQAARRGFRGGGPLPEPCQHYGRGFAKAGWRNEGIRPVALGERPLVGEWGGTTEGSGEELAEGHRAWLSMLMRVAPRTYGCTPCSVPG